MVDHPIPIALRERVTTQLGTIAAGEHAPDQLKAIMASGLPIATDIETFGLGKLARRLKSVSVAAGSTAVVLDPRADRDARMIRWAYATAHREGRPIVLHNSTFDVPNLHLYGLWEREWCSSVDDVLIWARLAWPGELVPKTLDAVTVRVLNINKGAAIDQLFRVNGWRSKAEGYLRADLDLPAYVVGSGLDALATAQLRDPVRAAALAAITEDHPFGRWGVRGDEALRLRDREQIINRMMLRRACRGLRVDEDYYARYLDQVTTQQEQRAADLTAVGVRPANTADLSRWAENAGLLDGWPMNKTGPKMDKTHQKTLAKIIARRAPGGDNIAETFRLHKQTAKDLTDYLGKVHDLAITDSHGDARIHPVTNLLAAVTGRMSMGSPPLHQFTDAARGIIVAERGERLVSIDWSQIEPVVFANIAGDLDALAGYESGETDFYTDLAARAGIERSPAKTVLLAQLYGQGISSLALRLLVDDDEARALRAFIFRALPACARLIDRYRRIAEQHQQVFTLSGRILPIGVGRYGVEVHKGVNYPTQGGAYDILAEDLVLIEQAGLGDAVYHTMHDETVVAESAAHDIRTIMERPPARLIELARVSGGRASDPILRTDMQLMPERWMKV